MLDVWDKPIEEPKNPCVNRCAVSSATGYCASCYMSLVDIAKWDNMTEWERRQCLEQIEERKNPK